MAYRKLIRPAPLGRPSRRLFAGPGSVFARCFGMIASARPVNEVSTDRIIGYGSKSHDRNSTILAIAGQIRYALGLPLAVGD